MDVHLEQEDEQQAGNHRNGKSRKRVLTDTGAMEVATPRHRHGGFEPQLIEKYHRRLPGFDEKMIALCAGGVTTREIQAHVRELYGIEVSPELISKVTDASARRGPRVAVQAARVGLRDSLLRRGAGEDPRRGLARNKGKRRPSPVLHRRCWLCVDFWL